MIFSMLGITFSIGTFFLSERLARNWTVSEFPEVGAFVMDLEQIYNLSFTECLKLLIEIYLK